MVATPSTEKYPHMLERFIKYAKENTRSDIHRQEFIPTTPEQEIFLKELLTELVELGFDQVAYDPRDAYVTACLPGNLTDNNAVPAIGFIAHVDTADYPSENIQPQVFANYNGQDICLNADKDIWMRVSEFPNLKNYLGQTLITTDGTTLLGADDKAGMTSIIEACLYLMAHPEIPHGDIWLAFGPDEEIGIGAHRFEVDKFPVEFAYTLDSGVIGKLEWETFNAAKAIITIQGTSVHPGQAKDVMVNALTEACRFQSLMPTDEVPEKTTGYQGYYMLSTMKGNLDQVTMTYNIRDHDHHRFLERKQFLTDLVAQQNANLDYPRWKITLVDQYANMGPIIQKDPRSLDLAVQSYHHLGIEPDIQPFRGGTDGCIISYKGIPTPNLFTGAENLHGCYEFVALESMALASDVVLEIIKLAVENLESTHS